MSTTRAEGSTKLANAPARVANWGDVTIGLIALATAAILFIGLLTMEVQGSEVIGPEVFPSVVAVGLTVLGLILILSGLVLRTKTHTSSSASPGISSDLLADVSDADAELDDLGAQERISDDQGEESTGAFDLRAVVIAFGSIAVFILVLQFLGWIIASTLLFAAISHAFGSRRPMFDLGVGFAIGCITQLLFAGMLGLALPTGFIGGIF